MTLRLPPPRWRSLTALAVLLLFLSLLLRADTLLLSPTARAATPHAFTIETWVLRNLPAKALERLRGLLPGASPSEEERMTAVREYFSLGAEVQGLQAELGRQAAQREGGDPGGEADRIAAAEGELREVLDRRAEIRTAVEETLEKALSEALKEQSLLRGLGPVRMVFPPLVFRLDQPPRLLVVSPRDRIQMTETQLLSPDLSLADAEGLEAEVELQEGRSALVLGLGGLAVYPSLVPDSQALRSALQTIAHEWLHQYWFFSPLGQAYFSTAEMTTVNETAAEIAGRELGDMVYEQLGFDLSPAPAPPTPASDADAPSAAFDFAVEMRETRLRVDELLEQGLVEEAEAYMETRRRLFVEHGHGIRKLNQAYFAFHGTYAVSPASSSPVAGQLEQVRAQAPDIGGFIRTVARFGSYAKLLDYVEEHEAAP